MKTEILTTVLKSDQISSMIEILKDLHKIKEHARIKVQSGILSLYAIDDPSGQVIAFKNYKKNVADFFEGSDLEDIDMVLLNLNKIAKQLNFYQTYNLPLEWVFETEDGSDLSSSTRLVKTLEIKNTKLRTFIVGGEPYLIKNLAQTTIDEKMDGRYKKFGFEVSAQDYKQILQLSALDTTSETVEILLDGKDIIFREKGWELIVGSTDIKESLLFKKMYLNNVAPKDLLPIDVFENYMVLKGGTDNDLMISLEKYD
jgi:hypothetical protein